MNKYCMLSGLFLMILLSASASAGFDNNHTCTNNSDCNSGYCAQGYCCNAGQCGAGGRCWEIGEEHQWSMNNGNVCTEEGWKTAYSRACTNNESCVTGRCINGACCNPDQCAMAYMSPLFCENVGEEVYYGRSQRKICVLEGVWATKTNNGYACTNDTDCYSNHCADGFCCNMSQCGLNGECFNQNETHQSSMNDRRICTQEGWMMDYESACSSNISCVTGKCINGACCNQDQCATAYMSPLFCTSVGGVVHYGPSQNWTCVSEGVWEKKISNGYPCNNHMECGSNNCYNNVCSPATTTTTTTTTTSTTIPCQFLWWFDDEHNGSCGYKEFCGEYMYLGLHTFENQSDCVKELACVGEGGHKIIVPGTPNCCAGLIPISHRAVDEWGACSPPATGASICTYCGNGVCGLGENKCNCPEDCPECRSLWYFDSENNWECRHKEFCGEYMYLGLRTFQNQSDCESELPCHYLWWFDNEHNESCGYKKFCSAYMYYGLHTFENESACLAELTGSDCVGEGGTAGVYPGAAECCGNLTPITPTIVEDGMCAMPVGASICTRCGNGICGIGENWCNCEEDCFNTSCRSLYWFDETNKACGYKQFCGGYMYYGLRTFETEHECLSALADCPDEVIVWASGEGSLNESHGMQLWVDGELRADWNAFDMWRQYRYEINLSSCGLHKVDVVNKEEDMTLSVFQVRVGCSLFAPTNPSVLYDRGVNSSAFDGVDVLSGRSELTWPGALRFSYIPPGCEEECALVGDYPPCGAIDINEIVALVIKWSEGDATLQDVINLINAWKNP